MSEFFKVDGSIQNLLPIMVVLLPFIFTPLILWVGNYSEKARDYLGIIFTGIILLLVTMMYPQALDGGIKVNIPYILGERIILKVDMLAFTMAFISSIVWFFAWVYAIDYMRHEKHRTRFFAFLMLTFGGTLGTVISGDLLSLFIFFEIMSFSAYALVVHNQTKEAMDAGYNYIYLATFGGLCLLMGVLLYYSAIGTVQVMPVADVLEQLGAIKYFIFIFFFIGFGIKAGVIPLHIWLPKAHPVAPTPASALLSGIMIKIGAYGILRIVSSIYFYEGQNFFDDAGNKLFGDLTSGIGYFLIWLGVLTMFLGIFFALQQSNVKRLLAYSSISQMGYIIMGIGVCAYLGAFGVMGFSGAIYHIVNHALIKAILFMVVGAVYLKTREYELFNLGGLWRKMPFTALVCFIAFLGVTGLPLFNGFVSKTMLHHAIVEAYQYGEGQFLWFAEFIFTVTSIGTFCAILKLFKFTFLGKCPDEYKNIKKESVFASIGMGALALLVVLIGFFPNAFIKYIIEPTIKFIGFEPEFTNRVMGDLEFFVWHEIQAIVIVYVLGLILFTVSVKYNLFHLRFPNWLSIENIIYKPVSKGFVYFCNNVCGMLDRGVVEEVYIPAKRPDNLVCEEVRNEEDGNKKLVCREPCMKDSFNLMNLDTDFMVFAGLLVIVIIVLFMTT